MEENMAIAILSCRSHLKPYMMSKPRGFNEGHVDPNPMGMVTFGPYAEVGQDM